MKYALSALLCTVMSFAASLPDCRCDAQELLASPPESGSDVAQLRLQRREFQSQQLITTRPNNWIFNPGDPPGFVWRDPGTVRRLGFDSPLRVRWFDAHVEEHTIPDEPGRWAAVIEGTAPNGSPFRRSYTLYARPRNFLVFPAPQVSISFPEFPGPIEAQVWWEHTDELDRTLKELLFQSINDSEQGAVLLAGLSELQRLGHPARFVDSATVRNEDFHLALKLRLSGLEDRTRPLQPPRPRESPATVLHAGPAAEAGVHPDTGTRIDALCRDWAEETGEPFVTLIARNGIIITHEAFGVDTNGRAIDTEYRCWVGSITKTVTALLFSRFLDEGLIDLDDSLSSVFPDYPQDNSHVPTFRQCLNHTSGLAGHGEFGGIRNPNLENIVLNGIDVNEPGVRYTYSGAGFELVARAMEIIAGQSAARLYDEHLFQPLGFNDVPMGNASSGGEFTAWELGVLAQWIANRGSYGDLDFISPVTFDRLLPEPLQLSEPGHVREEGIGMHWDRRLKPGAPSGSQRAEDLLFSPNTVRHGSFSGCIFVIDLDQQLVIVQARRNSGPLHGEWSSRFLEVIADHLAAIPSP